VKPVDAASLTGMPIDRFHHPGRTRPTPRWRQLHRRRRTRAPRTRPSLQRWRRPRACHRTPTPAAYRVPPAAIPRHRRDAHGRRSGV